MDRRTDTAYVVFRTDGARPFGIFFSEATAKMFVNACMTNPSLVGISKRQIKWKWGKVKLNRHKLLCDRNQL